MTQTQARGAAPAADALVQGYFAMWNEADPRARREVVTATWAPPAAYVDPLFTAEGYDGLDTMVEAVHQRFPGHEFRLTGAVDAHHDRLRWSWELASVESGDAVASGVDFAVLAGDGRLAQVTGFIEAPAGAGQETGDAR